MAGTDDDNITFFLLADEYPLFLKAARGSDRFALKLVERYLSGGERDRQGRRRYRLWSVDAYSGGLEPISFDGDFWRSYPERGVCCTIRPWDSAADWTGPTSAWWKEFDGRQTAHHQVFGIQLNHALVLEFLESAVGLPLEQSQESASPSSPPPPPPESVSCQPSTETSSASKIWPPERLEEWLDQMRAEFARQPKGGGSRWVRETAFPQGQKDFKGRFPITSAESLYRHMYPRTTGRGRGKKGRKKS
jgi:hypothetical protein